MSDYYSSRIDENTRLINTQGRTFLVYEGKDFDGKPHELKIEITNIRMTLLALQDMISSKAREW